MSADRETPEEEGHAWQNIGRIIFLVVVLVAAWYVLEWLIGK